MEPGFHPDGTRTWRFVPSADPRKWSDLEYIDNHLDEVKNLGWIEDNPQGEQWTVEEATKTYDEWEREATEMYRTVDYGDGPETFPHVPAEERAAQAEAQYAESQAWRADQEAAAAAAPPAPPMPAGAAPAEPAAPAFTHGDVMDELRQRVPENDGRWTATQAAAFDNDTAFFDEQGITAAQARMSATADAAMASPDGVVTQEGFNAVNEAGADVSRASIHADSTRNRYQQTTDYQPPVSEAEQMGAVDQDIAAAREQAARDPQSMGLEMTREQQQDYSDAADYAGRTGQDIDLHVPLNAEQRAWLEQARQADYQ